MVWAYIFEWECRMAEEWDWSELLSEEESQDTNTKKVDPKDPKSLRQFATKTAKENEDLRKQIAEIHAATRVRAIAEKLAEKKVPEKFAKLIPADVSADKLDDWLKDYEDLWVKPSMDGQEEGQESEEAVAEREALGRMSAATGATVPATRPADLMAQIMDKSQTREGLMQLIERAGGGYGSG